MAYFAVFLQVADSEVAKKYREDHIEYVQRLCKEGKIHLVGKLHGAGGLIVFKAESKEEVEEWLHKDPFIIHGARTYELYEWDMHTATQYIAK